MSKYVYIFCTYFYFPIYGFRLYIALVEVNTAAGLLLCAVWPWFDKAHHGKKKKKVWKWLQSILLGVSNTAIQHDLFEKYYAHRLDLKWK